MALIKVIYVDGETVITAENLNDIQDAIIALENAPAQGLTEDMKQALLQIARKVAYIDDQGQTYYDDLYDAFYPPKTVVLITAVFEQGSTVIYDDTALDDLKQYLTVTAKYDDNTTAILADSAYTLSGLLEAGTSTVTVAYNGLTTTFTVNVTARPTLSSITAVYTQSGTVYDTDTLDSLKADLVVTAHYSDSSTQTVPAADYTLSGTLTVGTSTITVSYRGLTATFSVTVTAAPLYAFPERTVTETDYTLVTTKSGHLKLTVINPITWPGTSGIAINVYGGKVSALNDPDFGIKNQPKTFTIAANSSCVFAISSIANPSAASLSINLYKANAEASTGSTFALSATTSNESKSVTPTDSLDIFTPFIYVNLGTLPSGFTLECDLSLTVGNERYF